MDRILQLWGDTLPAQWKVGSVDEHFISILLPLVFPRSETLVAMQTKIVDLHDQVIAGTGVDVSGTGGDLMSVSSDDCFNRQIRRFR